MLRSFVEVGKLRPGFLRNDGRFVILPGEFAHGLQRVERHEGPEFDFSSGSAAQQLDASRPKQKAPALCVEAG